MHLFSSVVVLCVFYATCVQGKGGDWEKWENCELVEDAYMDGDSFYISRGARSKYIIRLYFVDCPESDNRFPDRVQEQADYFGISTTAALKCGDTATEFTRKALRRGFTVHTRKEKSYSASSKPRYYGFIEYGGGKFLGEELVGHGLARIYGKPADRPDGVSSRRIYKQLGKLKKAARANKSGAWKFNPDLKRSAKAKLIDQQFIEQKTITTDRTISIYTAEKPYKFRGLLRSGAELTLHELRENQYIFVSFDAEGKEVKGVCLKRDLGID